MLMAPDLTEWVPDDHVVWSILGAVDQMDLGDFYGAYREDGQGQAAYEPSMMGWIQLVVATPDVEELRNGQEESTYGSCRCCRDAGAPRLKRESENRASPTSISGFVSRSTKARAPKRWRHRESCRSHPRSTPPSREAWDPERRCRRPLGVRHQRP